VEIITLNPEYNIPILKDKIREIVKEYEDKNQDIHISAIYYEVNTFKKPKSKKKKGKGK
jgi:hypothetical protein